VLMGGTGSRNAVVSRSARSRRPVDD
jgi:hypothetical protein